VNVTPFNAAGTVQLKDNGTNVGAPLPLIAGFAFNVRTLPAGHHSLTAVFTPVNPAAFQLSTSNTVAFTF
jgi:Bacterial Ig-like domain (group 3)